MKNKPPIPLDEIHESILKAIRDLDWKTARLNLAELVSRTPAHIEQALALEHTIPSPSGVTDCRRKLWFKSHSDGDGRALPEAWIYAAAVGTLVEPWWCKMLGLADPRLKVTNFTEPLDIAPGVRGMPDGNLEAIDSLFELKSSGGWDYIYTKEEGVYKQNPGHVAQTNLYMDAAGKDWCLILHNTVAPALVKWIKNRKRDPNFEYPFFSLTWIRRDPEYVAELKERLLLIQEDKLKDTPAPREHSPSTTKWPCQVGCPNLKRCLEIG